MGSEDPLETDNEDAFVVRHEESASVDKAWRAIGQVRARKEVDVERVRQDVPYETEDVRLERIPAADGDSGTIETLPDGSISIPLFEEELVVTRRSVLRERVIVRKETVTEHKRVEADVRKERIEFEADDEIT
jgi:uncharacterized protein (TIGR02271 family)